MAGRSVNGKASSIVRRAGTGARTARRKCDVGVIFREQRVKCAAHSAVIPCTAWSRACTTPSLPTRRPPSPSARSELAAHRAYLIRFAQRKLRDPALAEDAVHDVLEAVLAGRAAFGGRSALRSWLTGILKHKIVDLVRRDAFSESLDAARGEEGDDSPATPACGAPRPDEVAEQRQLLSHALARIAALPAALRDVVRLRVLDELPTAEVCKRLAVSEANLFVRLHRARRQLVLNLGPPRGPPQARPDPRGGSLAVPGERGVVGQPASRARSSARQKRGSCAVAKLMRISVLGRRVGVEQRAGREQPAPSSSMRARQALGVDAGVDPAEQAARRRGEAAARVFGQAHGARARRRPAARARARRGAAAGRARGSARSPAR